MLQDYVVDAQKGTGEAVIGFWKAEWQDEDGVLILVLLA
jgi:hypothetical protein